MNKSDGGMAHDYVYMCGECRGNIPWHDMRVGENCLKRGKTFYCLKCFDPKSKDEGNAIMIPIEIVMHDEQCPVLNEDIPDSMWICNCHERLK